MPPAADRRPRGLSRKPEGEVPLLSHAEGGSGGAHGLRRPLDPRALAVRSHVSPEQAFRACCRGPMMPLLTTCSEHGVIESRRQQGGENAKTRNHESAKGKAGFAGVALRGL